ncbi:hypothetical protein FORMB_20580 [Formosa sp. Hel1_33_131]|nr:hypothetical protein FORMB_20580 [Formosa sp. Hel1_33_131]
MATLSFFEGDKGESAVLGGFPQNRTTSTKTKQRAKNRDTRFRFKRGGFGANY